ncbi:MAG TPA: hypothetical protein PK691_06120, partial [Thermomicrobiales bacterium]|nr:hypothetical protein [Thermomicrobiales bacterium]
LQYLLIVAFVSAPLLGLLYGREIGLATLALALILVLTLALPMLRHASPEQFARLRPLLLVNGLLLVLALGILVVVLL